jgi:hypothetical protein
MPSGFTGVNRAGQQKAALLLVMPHRPPFQIAGGERGCVVYMKLRV